MDDRDAPPTDLETYRLRVHLVGGQTVTVHEKFPAELDEDEVVQLVERMLHRRAETAYRVLDNLVAHTGAVSAVEVEAL